jgi:hypothetical protein
LAWSPDDTMMVTVAMDKDAILWNTLVSPLIILWRNNDLLCFLVRWHQNKITAFR